MKNVFFYGLFMDEAVLRAKGVMPRTPRRATVHGMKLSLGARAFLVRSPAVCLFVRPENEPAIGLYERIGMRRTFTYRSLIFG